MHKDTLALIKELRNELHLCPELGGNVFRTKNTLIEFIKEHTNFEIVDKGNWFYVYYDEGATKTIGFRADMDAVQLPDGGITHACGHDGHSAVLAGVILELQNAVERGEKKNKNCCFIYQFGEETGEGGQICSEAIIWKKIDEIYAFHNIPGFSKGTVLIKNGTFACTSKGMILRFHGSPTHAAYPEYGNNPAVIIGNLLSRLPWITRLEQYAGMILSTVIGVRIGSNNFGIAASEGEIFLTIRGELETDMLKLQENLQREAKELADVAKIVLSIEYKDEFPETINHEESIKNIKEKCQKNKIPVVEIYEPFRWSEDFGYYLKKCRGAMIGIGDGEGYDQLHTATYEFPDDILERAVDVFWSLL